MTMIAGKGTRRRILEAVAAATTTGRVRLREAPDSSLNDRMRAVSQAVSAAYNQQPGDYSYVEVVFDDYVIICKGGKLWKVEYTLSKDGAVTLSGEPVQVRTTYTPISEGVLIGLLPDSDTPVQLKEGETAPAPTGKRWAVLIIQEGLSKNRNNYKRKVLQEASPLYEGARIFMDHQEEQRRFGRSTRDVAGFLKNVEGVVLRDPNATGTQEAQGVFALAATAVITNKDVRDTLMTAYQEGNTNLFGLSHDVEAESTTVMAESGPFYDVQRIDSVSSVDFVTNPAAGGRVLRLVASDTVPHTLEGDGRMLKKMIEAIKASGNAALIAKLTALGATPNEDQVMGLYTEALQATGTGAPATTPTREAQPAAAAAAPAATTPATTPTTAAPTQPATTQVQEAQNPQLLEAVQDARTLFLETTLNGTSLHEPVKAALRKRINALITEATTMATLPTKAGILAMVKESVDLFAELAEKQVVMPASGRPRAEVVKDRQDKFQEALDDFFGMKRTAEGKIVLNPDAKAVSFRNIYVEFTGDLNVTGQVREAKKLTESLTTTSFDQILGDSITRRMVAEYVLQTQQEWRGTIAEVVPVTDFRTQRRMRFGGYGNLTTVTQGSPYPAMTSPTDEEATYTPAKRGGTEQLTIEMIANDDVGSIRRIPGRMSRAAYQTLREFVLDFMAANPTIYDSTALFTTGGGSHLNLISSALTASNVASMRLLIKKQPDMSNGKRIGLNGKLLWVPADLEQLAYQITGADRAVPDSNVSSTAAPSAPNFLRAQGIVPKVVDYWTDTDNYFLTADIGQTPMIELGFWGGEEPQLFVQDQPNQGSLFSNDAITYKMRHVYGGAVLDFRGFAASIL